ncbi:MAG: DUF2892 domain-containing protein [Nanoarchaeota archaeon]|jgi:hypothetical protein|nr:DUF2892 domain-containing protein [Nanoarchaeota archaeon]
MKNESSLDRYLRFIFAVVSFFIGFFYLKNVWQYVAYIIGLIFIITSFTGFCGIYKLLGIYTIKKKK